MNVNPVTFVAPNLAWGEARGGSIPPLSFPGACEIRGLMKGAAPHALSSDMLNQRRAVIENGPLQPTCQARDTDVLHSFDAVPVSNDVFGCGPGKQQRLAAKDELRFHNQRVVRNV